MKQNYIRDKFYNIDNKLVTLSVVCSYIDGQGEKLQRKDVWNGGIGILGSGSSFFLFSKYSL